MRPARALPASHSAVTNSEAMPVAAPVANAMPSGPIPGAPSSMTMNAAPAQAMYNGQVPTRDAVLQAAATDQAMNSFVQEHSWLARLTGLFSSETTSSFGVASLFGWADATKAMSLLKQYQVAEMVYLTEDHPPKGGFASMRELKGDRGMSGLDSALLNAWDSQPGAQPLQGYFFSEIETDAAGTTLDRSSRAGLCAYPEKPSSAYPVLCMLLELPTSAPQEGVSVNGGEMWNFYRADSTQVRGAIRRWPADSDLASTFVKLKKRSPGEALAEAKQLAAQAGVPQYPTPELAQRAHDAQVNGEADVKKTSIQGRLAKLKPLLYIYFEQNDRVPTPQEGLQALVGLGGGVVKSEDLIDPWGQPFNYKTKEETIRNEKIVEVFAYSSGPDRQPDTADDIYPFQ